MSTSVKTLIYVLGDNFRIYFKRHHLMARTVEPMRTNNNEKY